VHPLDHPGRQGPHHLGFRQVRKPPRLRQLRRGGFAVAEAARNERDQFGATGGQELAEATMTTAQWLRLWLKTLVAAYGHHRVRLALIAYLDTGSASDAARAARALVLDAPCPQVPTPFQLPDTGQRRRAGSAQRSASDRCAVFALCLLEGDR
jgi:hypothetical protein